MTLVNKKEHILRCIQLGMELFKAELVAECTEEEMDEIANDEHFAEIVEQYQAIHEYDLLTKHQTAMDIQISTGRSGAVQWKLEKINPGRWGKDDETIPPDLSKLKVSLVGKGLDEDKAEEKKESGSQNRDSK